MVTAYWLLEYAKVLYGYLFLMFLWPSVVFRKYLRGKSRIFWFSFCVTAQVVLVNTVVLSLGLLHILNRWVVAVIFYGIFLWSLLKDIRFGMKELKKSHGLLMGTYGIRTFLVEDILGGGRRLLQRLWKEIRPRFGEYLLLCLVLLYGMIYFSYGSFQDYSYGFGDLYTHHTWIYGLIEGKIFSAGIYPEGMHCFVYCLYALLNIKVYNTLLFLQGIHVVVFLLSAYSLLREIFHIRYTPILVLVLFLTLDLASYNLVVSVSRLQWTLPQEFGLHTQFLCALYMVRYLKFSNYVFWKGKQSKHFWDENLLLFAMALSASIVTHFYPTIMAFFLCTSFALFSLKKIFSRKHFFPLVTAVIFGFLVAVIPIAGAYASGIPFQGSIRWAMGIINTSMEDNSEQDTSEDSMLLPDAGENGEDQETEDITEQAEVSSKSLAERVSGLVALADRKMKNIYWSAYVYLYTREKADLLIKITVLSVSMWFLYRLCSGFLKSRFKRQIDRKCFDGYLPMIFASFLYMVANAAQSVGLPQLVDGIRLCSTIHILSLVVILMPIDMLLSLLALFCRESILRILVASSMAGIYISSRLLGCYHGFLFCELSRYNSAVMVTNSIIETFPRHTYTIVSPTDELYQTILDGRHEELLTFMNKSMDNNYTLPTEYVFLYVEKKPIDYAQHHYFTGPSWLAAEKEKYDLLPTSECPAINSSVISEEAAQKKIMSFSNLWWSYTILDSRVILESKAYEWCQRFQELYPYEMNVYYEDDDFVCYFFRQEPNAPYNLAIG